MSVYKPKGSATYRYDFWVKGQRFSGSTECRAKPEAREVERRARDEAADLIRGQGASAAAPLTIDLAAGRFWMERGQFYRGGAGVTFKASLAWIVKEAGPNRLLTQFSNPVIAELVAKRRGEGVTNATVNRTVTEPLRRIMQRARKAWDQATPNVEWKEHLLPEPKERVRELRDDEEARLLPLLSPDYRRVVMFAILSGCRLAECVGLKWEHVDWGNREITVHGKGGTVAQIPMTTAMRQLLWPLQGQHPERAFTYGTTRQPISYEGMKSAWRRARAKSGVKDFRFHDTRHTAATRLLRSGANLKVVQRLLRHSDIATTSKYAHVTMDDVRAAMERVEGPISEISEASPEKIPQAKG